jgi:hypothetical protein
VCVDSEVEADGGWPALWNLAFISMSINIIAYIGSLSNRHDSLDIAPATALLRRARRAQIALSENRQAAGNQRSKFCRRGTPLDTDPVAECRRCKKL